MRLEIIGVYAVTEAEEPCHLLEWRVEEHDGPFDVSWLRQPVPAEPEDNWQAPYDEYVLSADGKDGEPVFGPFQVAEAARFCFFQHYLEAGRPFESPAGPVTPPPATDRPERLKFIAYETP